MRAVDEGASATLPSEPPRENPLFGRFLLFVALVLGQLFVSTDAQARAPVRDVATIAWAIGVDHKHLSLKARRLFAKELQDAGRRHNFDAFTGVALIWHESRWRAWRVSHDGEDFGLGQIRARYVRGCRRDIPGAQDTSSSCEAAKATLLNPVWAIRRMGALIAGKRAWCRKHTGKPALFARWLHAYGYKQRKNLKCNMQRTKKGWKDQTVPREIRRIIQYRKRLISLLKKRRSARKRRRK